MDGVMVDWVHWQTQRADLASKQAAETASGVIRIPFVFRRHGCFCELLLRSLTCANMYQLAQVQHRVCMSGRTAPLEVWLEKLSAWTT